MLTQSCLSQAMPLLRLAARRYVQCIISDPDSSTFAGQARKRAAVESKIENYFH
jgi:hypothetical protein